MGRKRKGSPKGGSPPPPDPPPPLTPRVSTEFRRGYKLQMKRGKDMTKLDAILAALAARRPLEPRHRDHALTGDWSGYRECHVEPDWLLVYRCIGDELWLDRTGTHSDLFG
jgi:mRNA interferase YafQ